MLVWKGLAALSVKAIVQEVTRQVLQSGNNANDTTELKAPLRGFFVSGGGVCVRRFVPDAV
jgi:hypothetical protein